MLNSENNVTVLDILFFLHAFPNLLVLAVASLAFETIQLLEYLIHHPGWPRPPSWEASPWLVGPDDVLIRNGVLIP